MRLAYTPTINSEIGFFGFDATYHPGAVDTGADQKYRDVGIDGQHQLDTGDSVYEFHARHIRETHSGLGGVNDSLNTNFTNVVANWYYQHRWGLGIGLFQISGDVSSIYAGTEGYPSTGTVAPDTSGVVFQADYFPWENLRWSLQYVCFSKYHGATDNYDGNGRNTSDNNSLTLNALLGF